MVSLQKTSSALNLIPEEEDRKMNPTTSKSCESLYSNCSRGSANIIYRRKPNDSLNNRARVIGGTGQPTIISATNEVRQRVLSARRLRMKTYQNQLADAQQTIAELAHENRILRTVHKRQDSALSKYEATNAELPQLLHSHAEEIRVWQTKYRNLQAVNKELEQKLKQKDTAILSLSDQNKYFIQLNKDKNLEDRQRLTEKLQILESRLQEKDNDIKLTARKMQLETKQVKQQLQVEQKRNREILMKLEKARLELSGYRKLEELQLQDKFATQSRRNKLSNNDLHKEEKEIPKYSLAKSSEAEITDETDILHSQRSSQSSNNMGLRTTRSIKNPTTKNNLTGLSSSSTIVIQQVSKQQKTATKTVLRHTDQGDGDASNAHDVAKTNYSLSASLMHKQHSNLSSMKQSEQEKFADDYEEDVDYENDDVDDGLAETKEFEENITDNVSTDTDVNGDYVSNIDSPNAEIDNVNYNDDYYKESEKPEVHNPGKKTRMKEEISNIRKQLSDDYKEREAFLDTFCRQATTGIVREETVKKRTSIAAERSIPSARKQTLLAALKAIDDNKSQD